MRSGFFKWLRERQKIRKIERELRDFRDHEPQWAEARTKVR
jgi:hypothetical protein